MNIFAKDYSREGNDTLMPEGGSARFFALLSTHFWKYVEVNLLFVLFSLPIVTFPASLCAMNRVLVKLIREGNVMVWQDFRDEFKADVFSMFLPGVLFFGLVFEAYFFMVLAVENAGYPGRGLILWGLGLLMLLFGVCVGEYYFILKAEVELSGLQMLKNAVLLSLTNPVSSLAVLAAAAAAFIIAYALMPVSIALILLILPVMAQYIACFAANSVIQKRMIGPYEAMNSEPEENP